MATQTEERETFDLTKLPTEASSRAREVWLAGLGALARAQDEGDRVFRNLVERGEQYEEARRKDLDKAAKTLEKQQQEAREGITKTVTDTYKSVEQTVANTLTETLGRIGVPTRNEVRGLSDKVGQLSAKLDALATMLDAQESRREAKKKSGTTDAIGTTYLVVPREEGWAVIKEGNKQASSTHETKKDALAAGREIAGNHAPSTLIIHKQDNSVQETLTYEGGDDN